MTGRLPIGHRLSIGLSICPTLIRISFGEATNKPATRTDKNTRQEMIRLTRINRVPLVLNSDLIEHLEVTPDTVIAMTTGDKFMVLESADDVIQKVVEFRRSIADRLPPISEPDEQLPAHYNEER